MLFFKQLEFLQNMMQNITERQNYAEIVILSTNDLHSSQKNEIVDSIALWQPKIADVAFYVEERFRTYQYVLLAKKKKLSGVFFIDYFSVDNDLYLYIGSAFSPDFFVYANTFIFLFNYFSTFYPQIYLLAEAQNPTLVPHWHFLFPKGKAFSVFNCHELDKKYKFVINEFQKQIKHFINFDLESFKTKSDCTLFKKSKRTEVLTDFFLKHNINLNAGESIVLFASINRTDLMQMKENMLYWIKGTEAMRVGFIQNLLTNAEKIYVPNE